MRPSPRGGRPSAAALGAAAVVAAVLAVLLVRSLWPSGASVPSDFGARPRAQEPTAGPSSEVHDGGPGEAGNASGPAPEPTALRVPRVSLDARLQDVGVKDDGTVEIPDGAGQAGWYRYGPAPGAPAGSAVLIGHVDDRTGDLGAFAKLYGIRKGDDVTVAREGAPPVRYEVTAREVVDKDGLPDEVFRRHGRPVLTLITCAPPYDRERGGYQRNLLVYAVPVQEHGQR
ncbi:class F sortase [Streptomyces prasinopilosus]|uniref:LPXTG-site transpeptidase (Sortase) family protein n=1 Tax=Streptomyces prasinopilosus TaxID=67344 RepID=A0A1G6QX34_9ACTN|nr:class F sortase [Streptomyces prasinopilosus]SDC96841.1 LPXTG-site transpeptidase (sortase) family protein [Streptomyces prasinopilosus]